MRLNKFIANGTGLSRRAADKAIADGRITLNGNQPTLGANVTDTDDVKIDGQTIQEKSKMTIMMNKPDGYVCSRDGQGSKTVYNLLPIELHYLKPVGRLDKDSSGLLLLTNDGDLANKLTHPSFQKEKVYEVTLDKSLGKNDEMQLQKGVELEDGLSKFKIKTLSENKYEISMREGRNRQIRRTFNALSYDVTKLHRTTFGTYVLANLELGSIKIV